MDLTKVILGLSNSCFLCFKEDKSSIHLKERIEIQDTNSTFVVTLLNVVKYLFPFYEIITTQSCNNCSDVITKTYLLIRNGIKKLNIINKLMDNILQVINIDSELNEQIVIKIGQKDALPDNQQESEFRKPENKEPNYQKPSKSTQNFHQPLICEVCNKNFKSHISLQRHIQSHTNITCPYCQKSFKNNSFYKIHLKNHTDTLKRTYKTLNCTQCSYSTKNLSNLQSHINKNHLNIKPYICDICKNSFYRKSNLIEHLNTHNKIRDLMCEHCGENFSYKKTLNQHINLHKGLRPYKCEICSRTFVTNSRKNEHAKKHRAKIFACTICLKSFSLKKELNRHFKVHSINEQIS